MKIASRFAKKSTKKCGLVRRQLCRLRRIKGRGDAGKRIWRVASLEQSTKFGPGRLIERAKFGLGNREREDMRSDSGGEVMPRHEVRLFDSFHSRQRREGVP
jgi:hypothetical protein